MSKGDKMTKAYTISSLIKEVSSLNASQLQNFNAFTKALSPRAGSKSRKIQVLNSLLKGKLRAVFNGSTLNSVVANTAAAAAGPAGARSRVVAALRLRKANVSSSYSR
jgi:hypothetical protein